MCELKGINKDRYSSFCDLGVSETETPAHEAHAPASGLRSYHRMTLLLVVGSFLFLSCEGNNDAERLAALDSEISAMIADASCNELADCRVIAYGAKPCGGPWTYLIYCVSAVDSARLVSLVSMHNALESAINRKQSLLSDCEFVTPPHLGIVEGTCADTLGR